MSKLFLPPDSSIYRFFAALLRRADRVIFAGLPGVGKSLLLQQLTLMAIEAGRSMHLLQWDSARQPFETPKYPLHKGATHPIVIKAVGVWLRQALVDWEQSHIGDNSMLIGEVPLIGGRLIEIARPADDEAEAPLADSRTQFVLPVPSRTVRAVIESRRENTIANPQHANERQDAPPGLLRASWQDLILVAAQLGLYKSGVANLPYSPEIYEAVYRHLLQHRQVQVLSIDELLQPLGSVYDFDVELPHLAAEREQAQAILTQLEATTSITQMREQASKWYVF